MRTRRGRCSAGHFAGGVPANRLLQRVIPVLPDLGRELQRRILQEALELAVAPDGHPLVVSVLLDHHPETVTKHLVRQRHTRLGGGFSGLNPDVLPLGRQVDGQKTALSPTTADPRDRFLLSSELSIVDKRCVILQRHYCLLGMYVATMPQMAFRNGCSKTVHCPTGCVAEQ